MRASLLTVGFEAQTNKGIMAYYRFFEALTNKDIMAYYRAECAAGVHLAGQDRACTTGSL